MHAAEFTHAASLFGSVTDGPHARAAQCQLEHLFGPPTALDEHVCVYTMQGSHKIECRLLCDLNADAACTLLTTSQPGVGVHAGVDATVRSWHVAPVKSLSDGHRALRSQGFGFGWQFVRRGFHFQWQHVHAFLYRLQRVTASPPTGPASGVQVNTGTRTVGGPSSVGGGGGGGGGGGVGVTAGSVGIAALSHVPSSSTLGAPSGTSTSLAAPSHLSNVNTMAHVTTVRAGATLSTMQGGSQPGASLDPAAPSMSHHFAPTQAFKVEDVGFGPNSSTMSHPPLAAAASGAGLGVGLWPRDAMVLDSSDDAGPALQPLLGQRVVVRMPPLASKKLPNTVLTGGSLRGASVPTSSAPAVAATAAATSATGGIGGARLQPSSESVTQWLAPSQWILELRTLCVSANVPKAVDQLTWYRQALLPSIPLIKVTGAHVVGDKAS